jgi:signal transduction histidine kinase
MRIMANFTNITNEELAGELYRRSQIGKDNAAKVYFEQQDEIKYLCRKLREAEQGKSDFLSNVRNEINNPLTSIIGLTAQMMEAAAGEKISQLSKLVHQEVFQLDCQIRNILAASEIEAGEVKLLVSLIDIASFVEAQIQYLKPKSEYANASLVYINECKPGQVFSTDGSLFQTVVINVIANAIEYSHKNSPILIKSKIENGFLLLEIQDFGTGIDERLKKRIFERFHQLDNGLTKEHRGQGLGLSIVTEFVSRLGGEVTCDSAPDFGTTMSIKLPELPASSTSHDTTSFGSDILFGDGEIF